jgi:hypothetical protein
MMMRIWMTVLTVLLAVNAQAVETQRRAGWQPGQPLPQEQPLAFNLANLDAAQEDIHSAGVLVNVGLKNENPTWGLTQTNLPVMVAKLLELGGKQPTANDTLSMKAKYNEPAYKGLELRITRVDGKVFETVHVYNGRIVTRSGRLVATDPGRLFEYWLWGTARIRREVVMGARIMPVLTFEQCRLMAQEVVDSLPRQCLLPDGDMLLDVKEPLTAASLRAKDFDGCLRHGVGIINTFPRRCVVPGGRVFVEPPRIIETPADAPLAEGVSNALPVGDVTPTTPLPTSTTVVVPGVGNFTVSTSEVSVLSSTAVVVSNSALGGAGGETALVPVTATVVLSGVSVAVVVTGTAVVPAQTQSQSVAVPLASPSHALDTLTPLAPAPVAKKVSFTSAADVNLGM